MEAASVEAAHKGAAGTIDVVGVAWAGNDDSYAAFVERHGLTFPNVTDSPGDIFRRYGVAGQPGWAFISRDGSVKVQLGALSDAELENVFAGLSAS